MRAEMSLILRILGIPVEVLHHEIGRCGQNEIGTRFSTLVERADWTMLQKYVIHNVANAYGKTATFMPALPRRQRLRHARAPVRGKDGKEPVRWRRLCRPVDYALYYIDGGIIKHARALNAITNPGTNS